MSINKKLQYIYKNGNFNDVNGMTPDEVNNAIAQSVANKSTIYALEDIELDAEYDSVLLEGIKVGDIINDEASSQTFIVVNKDTHIYLKGLNYYNKPCLVTLTYSDDEKYIVTIYETLEVGTKLYRHDLTFVGYLFVSFISKDATPVTAQNIETILQANNTDILYFIRGTQVCIYVNNLYNPYPTRTGITCTCVSNIVDNKFEPNVQNYSYTNFQSDTVTEL